MASGYLYVLANSAMPGLVKVGKTTRQPSERASELSGVTGVATPFIVVYEDHFQDCDAAEAFVHMKLASAGLRLSENREFFKASVSDVVKIIAAIHSSLSTRLAANDRPDDLLTPDDSEFACFALDDERKAEPWATVLDEADNHYLGLEGYIEDHVEALKLYRDAARLGSPMAFERIGDIYRYGQSVKADVPKALDFYKEGAKRGNYFCFAAMAVIFVQNKHLENARKALIKMLAGGEDDNWSTYLNFADRHVIFIENILFHSSLGAGGIDTELITAAAIYVPKVLDRLRENLSSNPQMNSGVREAKIRLASAINAWIDSHPIPSPRMV
jgi:hypothetical protein